MKDVEVCFGTPEDIENIDNEGAFKTIVWHYWHHGFSVFFDDDNLKRFSCAEIDNKEAVLWENKIFELTQLQIMELFNHMGFSEFEEEVHEWGEKRISFNQLMVDLYFDNGGRLMSVNYGVYFDGNTPSVFPN